MALIHINQHLICNYLIWMKLMQSFLQWLAASGWMVRKSIWAKSFIDLAEDLAHIVFVSELFHFNLLMSFKAVYASEFIQSFYKISIQMPKIVSCRFRAPSSIAVASTHSRCCPCSLRTAWEGFSTQSSEHRSNTVQNSNSIVDGSFPQKITSTYFP